MGNLFSIDGKTALVTGGSRGIGRMIARAYVEHGAKVYISSRKAEICQAVAEEFSENGECIALPADLSNTDEVERLANEMGERESQLDILINNAGATWGASLDEFPEKGWDKVMELNVKSVFFLTQKLLPLLDAAATRADPARVINIGSVDGLHLSKFENFSYSPSKAAVHHLTRMTAIHLAARNITVNAIAPGPFETQMMAPMIEKMGDTIRAAVPLQRFGESEDIAGLAIFLAARASAYITGSVIPLDGGIIASS
ncbi:MAG TPA: 3-oxoacyl-ACP reductase [Gammaproteobacteria bacterium]|nr:3-oxoacyl-ACP reductase [Gammaproteobacteria bacterium]|tara:strand:+ start:99 stop:869 length:771 start_codon:yes stop_codon:yes gene_type:complete